MSMTADEWHKLADERSAEIGKLRAEVVHLKARYDNACVGSRIVVEELRAANLQLDEAKKMLAVIVDAGALEDCGKLGETWTVKILTFLKGSPLIEKRIQAPHVHHWVDGTCMAGCGEKRKDAGECQPCAEVERLHKETLIAWNNWGKELEQTKLQVDDLKVALEGARQHLDPLRTRYAIVLSALENLLEGFIKYGEKTLEEDLKVRREAESAIKLAHSPWVTEKRNDDCGRPSCPEHGKCYCSKGETCGYCCLKADGLKCADK